jgi:hypothetical protein
MECHAAMRKDDWDAVRKLESKIDKKAAAYWRISESDLFEIQGCLARVDSSNFAQATEPQNSQDE